MSNTKHTIAIVGAGFSGSLLALQLLHSERRDLAIYLIEKGPAFGLGGAYSTRRPEHLLNVRAGNMSAYPDRTAHFQDWLAERNGQPSNPFTFAPRWVYGDYLQGELRAVAQSSRAAGRLILIQDEVVEVVRAHGRMIVRLGVGRSVGADLVALATGHGGPTEVVSKTARFAADPAFVVDPWAKGALDAIGPTDRVLLLGSGLTAVDVVAGLDARGHRGPIDALSRRGLLPREHVRFDGEVLAWTHEPGEPLSRALARFRREADRLLNWRRAFDGLRGQVQAIWKGLNHTERRRFLRHLRPWWDSHRHRMAPEVSGKICAHLADGRLTVTAGRLLGLRSEVGGVTYIWRARHETAQRADRTQWVINCTGAEGDPRRSPNPLIRRLIDGGLARPDPLNLGFEIDDDNRLIDAGGTAQGDLFALGPITRGALWETVSVPDIRIQAREVAQAMIRALSTTPKPALQAANDRGQGQVVDAHGVVTAKNGLFQQNPEL